MRKVITFLGKIARPTEYKFRNNIYSGHVFAEALHQFAEYDKMLVFTTQEARRTTYPKLESLDDSRIEAVDIPDGRTDAEMWQIFNKLTGVIDDGDVVIFDITHGFRSIPFFVFLAVAFIKSVRDVTIEAVYYGALELGPPAPVLDLSEFVDLLDWMNASEQFIEFGNAQLFADLLQQRADQLPETDRLDARRLRAAAEALEHTSLALRLLIPDQAMAASHTIAGTLEINASALAEQAPPFRALAEKVTAAYRPIAFPDPREPEAMQASLHFERQLVFWYLDRHLLLQAIGMAFEWLISWGVYHGAYQDLYKFKSREKVRKTFNKAQNKESDLRQVKFETTGPSLDTIPDIKKALALFIDIRDIRNNLLHAGNSSYRDQLPKAWEEDIEARCRELAELPLERGGVG